MGCRYRLHVEDLPGKPDIVIRKYALVLFVHGCFWHLHTCRDGTVPKSRTGYWKEKLINNRERDERHRAALRKQGWKILRIWECDVEKRPEKVASFLKKRLTDYEI